MPARTRTEIEQIWSHVDSIKKLFDQVIPLGPFGGIGLDGMLAWVPMPGLSAVVSGGAGAYLMLQGLRARASPATLLRMAGYLGFDTAASVVPVAGSVVDFIFQGHALAAGALQKDIESTHWVEMSSRDARANGVHEAHAAQARDNGLRRVVYLHD